MTSKFWFIYLCIVLIIKIVAPFNVQDLTKSLVFVSDQRGNEFGYSVDLLHNSVGKWLVVGAPKQKDAVKQKSNNEKLQENGAIFTCLLQKNGDKKVTKNRDCNKLDLDIRKIPSGILYSCNFENCTLQQSVNDDFNWTLKRGPTPSEDTGPSFDHTYKDSSNRRRGKYMYTEASTLGLNVGDSAMLYTPIFASTPGSCLRFWYHMYGATIGTLNVYSYTDEIGLQNVWNKDGEQGDKWIEGYVTIISNYPYKIVFEGIQGIDFTSDIALDDIKLYERQCPEDMSIPGGSIGNSLAKNPDTGNILSCDPTWKYNCSGQIQVSGMCYLLTPELAPENMTLLLPSRKQVCNSGQLDLIFLLDGSQSVLNTDFDKMKSWLRNIVSTLPIGPLYTQVGIAVYNSNPFVSFYLNKYDRVDNLRVGVKNLVYSGGGTATGKAIHFLTQDMFTVEHGMRPDAKHVAVVLTDGKSQDDVVEPAMKAKESGITLFAIGVGKAKLEELKAISSDPNFVFQSDDYSALEGIRRQLQESITSLESQGKTYTTEQSQSGFCTGYWGNQTIIGMPGLDDWSGGYATYTPKPTSTPDKPTLMPPVLTSFGELLHVSGELFELDSDNENEDIVIVSPTKYVPHRSMFTKNTTTNIKIDPTIASSVNSSSNQISKAATESINNPGNAGNLSVLPKSDSDRRRRATTNMDKTTFFDILTQHSTNIKVKPTQLSSMETSKSGKTSAASLYVQTTMFDLSNQTTDLKMDTTGGFSGEGSGNIKADERVLRKRSINYKQRSKRSSHQQSDKIKLELEAYAYFGYSMTSGIFLESNRIDLVIGAPRSNSSGNVFIIKKTNETDENIARHYSSGQMGSYFGYTLSAVDVNKDGFDDLFVGAPLWMGTHEDEGRVFVYLSTVSTNNTITEPELVVLSGTNELGARFGFSMVSPGDLNMDGYNDIVIGAPSTADGVGAIYVYNGRPGIGITRKPTQIIKATQRKKRPPLFFGFSVNAGLDVDGNGYKDFAVGAPGNDRALVLLTRPTIHVDTQLFIYPNVLNASEFVIGATNNSFACFGNGTKICVNVTICLSVHGVQIPSVVYFSYKLVSDMYPPSEKLRGTFDNPIGEIKVVGKERKCKIMMLQLKLPIRNLLTPITIQFTLQLSSKMPSTSKSALLDIFEQEPKTSQISFENLCANETCYSDLDLQCLKINSLVPQIDKATDVIITNRRSVTLEFKVENNDDAAHDVEIVVHYQCSLYFSQVLSIHGSKCMELINREDQNHNHIGSYSSNQTNYYNTIYLLHSNSALIKGQSCTFKLQFGISDTFNGGNVNIYLGATSNSVEVAPINNQYNMSLHVKFEADITVRSSLKNNPITFSAKSVQNTSDTEQIGPSFSHIYTILNKGPSKIPFTSIQAFWPKVSVSNHHILFLERFKCTPETFCQCNGDLPLNEKSVNSTNNMTTNTNPNTKLDLNLYKKINDKSVALECTESNKLLCGIIYCSIDNFFPRGSIVMSFDFRLWKNTFLENDVSEVFVSSTFFASTKQSVYIVSSNNNNNNEKTATATTQAFNTDVAISEETQKYKIKWWIYVASALAGIVLLLLAILALKKTGFFKSKYKQHIQEEMDWSDSYRYTVAHQTENYNDRGGMTSSADNGNELSTFQRKLPQSPTL